MGKQRALPKVFGRGVRPEPWNLGGFLVGAVKFSHPESHGKIPNLMITELFYSQILNMNRGSLHTRSFRRIHLADFRYRWTKNGFTGPKSSQCFRETGLCTLFQTKTWLSLTYFRPELKADTPFQTSQISARLHCMKAANQAWLPFTWAFERDYKFANVNAEKIVPREQKTQC